MNGWLFDEDSRKGCEAVFISFVLVPEPKTGLRCGLVVTMVGGDRSQIRRKGDLLAAIRGGETFGQTFTKQARPSQTWISDVIDILQPFS